MRLNAGSGFNFLSSDTSAVVDDVRKAPGSAIAKAFLVTARHQLESLATDAS